MKYTREEIVEKLKEILRGMDGEKYADLSSCGADTHLRTGLGLTSVGMLYLVIIIEDAFSIRFDTQAVNDFITVGDIVSYIEAKQP